MISKEILSSSMQTNIYIYIYLYIDVNLNIYLLSMGPPQDLKTEFIYIFNNYYCIILNYIFIYF